MNAENGARGPNEEPQPAADNQVALPMVPQPAGKADDNLLRKIFPEEIWIKILKEMHASSDLKSVSKASPYFGNLLQGRRVEYLFPEVLQVLVPATRNDRDRNVGRLAQDNLVPLRPLRAVCKNWREAVDGSFYTPDAAHFTGMLNDSVWDFIIAAYARMETDARADLLGLSQESPYLREFCLQWLE